MLILEGGFASFGGSAYFWHWCQSKIVQREAVVRRQERMRANPYLITIGACVSQIAFSQMSETSIGSTTQFGRCDTLPDLLTMFDGTKVVTREDWSKRKEELRR